MSKLKTKSWALFCSTMIPGSVMEKVGSLGIGSSVISSFTSSSSTSESASIEETRHYSHSLRRWIRQLPKAYPSYCHLRKLGSWPKFPSIPAKETEESHYPSSHLPEPDKS